MRIGYARPSPLAPIVLEQVQQLRAAGAEQHIWRDHAGYWTERNFAVRACREGDEFLVCSLYLLGKNAADVVQVVEGIVRRGATLRCLDSGSVANVESIALVAELRIAEREWRREQTAPAGAKRKTTGKLGGRKPKLTPTQIEAAIKWRDEGESFTQIAARFADLGVFISRSSVLVSIRRYLAENAAVVPNAPKSGGEGTTGDGSTS